MLLTLAFPAAAFAEALNSHYLPSRGIPIVATVLAVIFIYLAWKFREIIVRAEHYLEEDQKWVRTVRSLLIGLLFLLGACYLWPTEYGLIGLLAKDTFWAGLFILCVVSPIPLFWLDYLIRIRWNETIAKKQAVKIPAEVLMGETNAIIEGSSFFGFIKRHWGFRAFREDPDSHLERYQEVPLIQIILRIIGYFYFVYKWFVVIAVLVALFDIFDIKISDVLGASALDLLDAKQLESVRISVLTVMGQVPIWVAILSVSAASIGLYVAMIAMPVPYAKSVGIKRKLIGFVLYTLRPFALLFLVATLILDLQGTGILNLFPFIEEILDLFGPKAIGSDVALWQIILWELRGFGNGLTPYSVLLGLQILSLYVVSALSTFLFDQQNKMKPFMRQAFLAEVKKFGALHNIKNAISGSHGRLKLRTEKLEKMLTDKSLIKEPILKFERQWMDSTFKSMKAAVNANERILGTVNGLANFENLDRKDFTWFPLAPVIAGIKKDLKPEDARVLQIDIPENLVVYGAENLLETVLTNIVQNSFDALKDLDGSMDSKVRISTSDKSYFSFSNLTIQIDDNGPGISQEHWPHLLDPFHSTRSNDDPSRYGGMGIGLSHVKMALEELGFGLEISTQTLDNAPSDDKDRDSDNHGTSVRITVPSEYLKWEKI